MLRTTSPRGTHRAPGPAVIDYRGLARPVGRTVGGVAVLGAVTAGAAAQGGDVARAETAAAGLHGQRIGAATGTASTSAQPSIVLSNVKLRPGARGEAVRLLQQALNQQGASIRVDGSFGSATAAAVRDFQGASGLGVDGIVGPRTRSALVGTAPSATAVSQPKLRRGDRGDAVSTLQRKLNERGASINVDGSFGRATLNAVYSLQRSAGIGVDGVVGPKTWSALGSSGASAAGSSTPAAPAAKPSTGKPKLRSGDRGSAVSTLQRKLNERGASIGVDGSFGPATTNAVRGLQRAAGIGVDGVVGPKTWSAADNSKVRISSATGSRGNDRSTPGSSSSFNGQSILSAARSQIGTRYVWGGNTSAGLDCSGLVHYSYNQAGFNVPRRTAKGYAFGGTVISKSEAQIGDLVVFSDNDYGHIGIYAGNGRIVDASGSRRRVVERNIWNAPHFFVTYR